MPKMAEKQLTEAYMVQRESRVLFLSLLCGASKRNKVYCVPTVTQAPAYAEMPACMVCDWQDAKKHVQSPAYAELPAYKVHARVH